MRERKDDIESLRSVEEEEKRGTIQGQAWPRLYVMVLGRPDFDWYLVKLATLSTKSSIIKFLDRLAGFAFGNLRSRCITDINKEKPYHPCDATSFINFG